MKRFAIAAIAAAVGCAPAVVVNNDPAPAPPAGMPITEPLQPVHEGAIVVHPESVRWGAAPASLPAGARAAVLDGDPTKPGMFTMRLWLPNDYRIAPHYHPAWEHLTVLSGVFHVGMGETFDMSKMTTELRAGSFGALPPGMRHFAHAAGETVLQIHAMGPWRLIYVNPADDPRRK